MFLTELHRFDCVLHSIPVSRQPLELSPFSITLPPPFHSINVVSLDKHSQCPSSLISPQLIVYEVMSVKYPFEMVAVMMMVASSAETMNEFISYFSINQPYSLQNPPTVHVQPRCPQLWRGCVSACCSVRSFSQACRS